MVAQPRVTIPQITPDAAESRASTAWTNVIAGLTSARPSQEDMNHLNTLVGRAGGDLDAAMEQFCEDRPNSCLTAYYDYTGGSTDFLITRGRLGFNQRALQSGLSERLSTLRQTLLGHVRELSDPTRRHLRLTIDTRELDRGLVSALAQGLASEFNSSRERRPASVPVSIRVTPGNRIELASLVRAATVEHTFTPGETRGPTARRGGGG